MFNEFDLKILKHIAIVRDKAAGKPCMSMGNIEFYPTEECNLNCKYCTFKDRERHTFPYSAILESLGKVHPASVTISGGGDPSCYESEGKNIGDVVELISSNMSTTKIGLITNGQKCIPGDWVQKLEWLRVSVDAGSQQTFAKLKGGKIENTLESLVMYLGNGCKSVGIGFVFNDENVEEVFPFTQLIFNTIRNRLGIEYLDKVFLEFRPTCKIESCDCQSFRYIGDTIKTSDRQNEWQEATKKLCRDIFFSSNDEYVRFVKARSNLDEKNGFKYYNAKRPFSRCNYCLIKMIIYPTGECYPCVQKSAVRECSLGNILTDDEHLLFENQQKCSRGELVCYDFSHCCNVISQKNAILEYYLNHEHIPFVDDIRWSDFF